MNGTLHDARCDVFYMTTKWFCRWRVAEMWRRTQSLVEWQTILRATGFVCCIIMIIGILGNTLNVASILHSKIKKLHGFDQNFSRISAYILNLSLIELFILIFGMVPNILALLLPDLHIVAQLCQIYPLVWRNSYILESVAIAVIYLLDGAWILSSLRY